MIRISGVVISEYKHIEIALTGIYGIGRATARRICAAAGVPAAMRMGDIQEAQLERLREEVAQCKIEGDLRRETQMNIKRLIDLGSYRGMRHRLGLPARGQRTRTNARTRKKPRPIRVKKS